MEKNFSLIAKNGLVVSSQPLATLAGVRTLMNGGNAVDAAVATAAVLSVIEPMSIGVGGDAFAIFYSAKDKAVKALDASGRSPYAASAEFYQKKRFTEMPKTGIHSVTVPGAVHGWSTLLDSYGTLPLRDALAPAIQYAEKGFPVSELTGEEWRKSETKLSSDPGARKHYLVGGKAPKPGELFKTPALAKTLRDIAGGGADAFYRGAIAKNLVRCSEKQGGLFAIKDFADHQSDWVEPIVARYRGHDVYELPPATQGFVTLEMLKILEAFDLKSMGQNRGDYLHLLIEAKKLAYADRDCHLADRDFMKISTDDLLSDKHIKRLRKRVRAGSRTGKHQGVPLDGDTEYVAAVDKDGNLVSFIQSLFMGFGSGVVDEETGIILQNRGHMFSLEEEHPNCIGSHKRCAHTLMPGMILKEGRPFAALGLKGGHVQPQVQAQILANLIDFEMSVQKALAAPRFNHLSGEEVSLEPGIPEEVIQELARRGHKIVGGSPESFGGAHGVVADSAQDVFWGGSDPRKGGHAIGF